MATVVTTSCFLVSVLIPDVIVSIFTKDQELIDLSARGLKILNLLWPVVGFQIIATNLFQSLGMVNKSIILSLSRQILFLLPMLYLLPLKFGSDGVWMSYPVSDLLAFLMTAIFLKRLYSKFNKLKDGDDPSILGSKL
jgi:Na+-driven multidrug efflux pump